MHPINKPFESRAKPPGVQSGADAPRTRARELCKACSQIPFRKLSTLKIYSDEQSIWDLGTLEEIRQRSNCPFCRLVEQALRDLPERRATGMITVEWFNAGEVFQIKKSIGATIRFVGSVDAAGGRQIIEPQFDIGMIKGWLSRCQTEHQGSCRPPPPDEEDLHSSCFRLIDVRQMCIVSASIKNAYVALSYVWGQAKAFRLVKDNQEHLMRPRGLADHWNNLPLTIQDAILLVQKMDLPYLWVDSICLVQDDSEDVMSGIRMMDTIYEQSVFTMLVASGTHANYGIPGVGDNSRRITQEVCEIEPELKLVLTLEMESLLKSSVYSSRAWTFHEYFLSYRRLVSVGDMCFFQCRTTSWGEDILEKAASPNVTSMMYLIQDEESLS
jgi:hypothetical protein